MSSPTISHLWHGQYTYIIIGIRYPFRIQYLFINILIKTVFILLNIILTGT